MHEFSRHREAHRQRLLTELMILTMSIGALGALIHVTLINFPRTLLLEMIRSLLVAPSAMCLYTPFFIPTGILNYNNEADAPWTFRIFIFAWPPR